MDLFYSDGDTARARLLSDGSDSVACSSEDASHVNDDELVGTQFQLPLTFQETAESPAPPLRQGAAAEPYVDDYL